MKFGLRFALLAQTKCQNMAPRLSRVTRLSTSSPSYDYASEDCTVVFDADGVALRGPGLQHASTPMRDAVDAVAREFTARESTVSRAQARTAWKKLLSCRA